METAYVLVYEKENEDLPQFVGPFMSCFKANIGLAHVLKDKRSKNIPPRKLEILSSLNTSGFDEKLQHKFNVVFGSEFETEIENKSNVEFFYELLIKYLFYADRGVGPTLSAEFFEVPSKHLFMCSKCGLTDLHNQNQLITSIESKIESEANFSKSLQFLTGVRVLTHCKCGPKEKKVLFCSLPSTLIFRIDNTAELTTDKIETLDFKTSIEHCYDLNSTKFCLKSILCKEGESYVSIIKTPNGFVKEENLTKTFEENFIVTDLSHFEQLYLLYSKSVGVVPSFLANLNIESMPLNQLQVLNIKLDRKLPKKIASKKTSFGVRITQSFITGLTGKTSWVTSDHINVYLKLLAEKSTFSVHTVDSSWFSEVLIKNKNPQELQWYINRLESKTIKWFDSQFIIIPVNEHGTHWTLLVIDTEKRKIIYCNSLGVSGNPNAKYICFQIWRYMCFEAQQKIFK